MIGQRQTSRIIWGAVALVALLAATTGRGEAQEGRWGRGGGGWGGGPLLGVPLKALNLTPDQQTQAHSIFANSFATARPLMQQLRDAQKALGDTLVATPTADVSGPVATINGLRGQGQFSLKPADQGTRGRVPEADRPVAAARGE